VIVFDSTALLAFLRGETGIDTVERLIDDADVNKNVH
jgi:PIN domain nuclease of toxin-antitoxin system